MSVEYDGKIYKVKKNKLYLHNKGITDITQIKGLDKLTDLVRLELDNNDISEIKGLEHLVNLKTLSLHGNNITKLKGLGTLKNLKLLYLGKNPIYKWAKNKFGTTLGIDTQFKDAQMVVDYCNRLEKEFEAKEVEKDSNKEKVIQSIKKMLQVSKRIKLDMMRNALRMEQQDFDVRIFDWAADFNFEIDGDYVNINKDTLDDFINMLDKQFEDWQEKESGRVSKI